MYLFQFYVMNIFDNILINNLCITLLLITLFCVFCRTLQAIDIDEYIKDLIAFLGKVSEENMGYWTLLKNHVKNVLYLSYKQSILIMALNKIRRKDHCIISIDIYHRCVVWYFSGKTSKHALILTRISVFLMQVHTMVNHIFINCQRCSPHLDYPILYRTRIKKMKLEHFYLVVKHYHFIQQNVEKPYRYITNKNHF